jgi:hypothetical protein
MSAFPPEAALSVRQRGVRFGGAVPAWLNGHNGRQTAVTWVGRHRTGSFGRSKCQNGHSRRHNIVAAFGPGSRNSNGVPLLSFRRFQDHPRPIGDVLSGPQSLLRAKSGQPVDCDARVRGGAALSADYNGRSVKAGYPCQGTRGSTLLVRVEDVVLRLHGHMACVSAI